MAAQIALEHSLPTRTPPHATRATIAHWLSDYVARLSRQDVASVDIERPFSHYDLDSIATVEMTADIEDWLGIRLEPTLIWDYPNIARLAAYLSGLSNVAR